MTNLKEIIATEKLSEWYRHLHENPELSFTEVETSQYIFNILSTFENIEVSRPTKTSVLGILKGNGPGKTIALRADIDALAIEEESDVEFKSKNIGVMHACGHDAHTAILLGAACALSTMTSEFSGTVKFIFQHAEETPPGGAKELVELGIVSDVDYIFGFHVGPNFPVGLVGTRVGPMMASTDIFKITIQGKGSHASTPHHSIDPITIGAEVVSNLNNIVSRNLDAFDPAVISLGRFTSGAAANVIPDTAILEGTIRTLNKAVRETIKNRIHHMVDYIIKAYDATYTLDWQDGYNVLENNAEAVDIIRKSASKIVGEHAVAEMPIIMGGEDFSAYLETTKGAFAFLGCGTAEEGCGYSTHHPKFKIDEKVLSLGVAIHLQTVMDISGTF